MLDCNAHVALTYTGADTNCVLPMGSDVRIPPCIQGDQGKMAVAVFQGSIIARVVSAVVKVYFVSGDD